MHIMRMIGLFLEEMSIIGRILQSGILVFLCICVNAKGSYNVVLVRGLLNFSLYTTSMHYSILGVAEGEGCTQNADCQSNLLCDGNRNICRQKATSLSYDPSFCSKNEILCQEWEGDCDEDLECEGTLRCGSNNCPAENNWSHDVDCCYQPLNKDVSGKVCLEDNTNYSGNDINDGAENLHPDAEHCRTFCKTNQPRASHFSWVSPSGPNWGHAPKKSCWCKTSDRGRSIADGITSGRVDCGKGNKSLVVTVANLGTIYY